MGRDETQQAICPIPPRASAIFGSRAVKRLKKVPKSTQFLAARQKNGPTKPRVNGFPGSRAVKQLHKASPGDSVFMNEGALRETKKLSKGGTRHGDCRRISQARKSNIEHDCSNYDSAHAALWRIFSLGYGDGVSGSISLQ